DGTLTTALLREDDVRRLWDGAAPFDAVLPRAHDLRLLRVTTRRLDAGREERLVSLGHDALAKGAAPWKQELERPAERRKWRTRGAVAAVVAVAFAGLSWSLAAKNSQLEAARTKAHESLLSEARQREEAEKERGEAERQRNLAVRSEQKAVADEARAK